VDKNGTRWPDSASTCIDCYKCVPDFGPSGFHGEMRFIAENMASKTYSTYQLHVDTLGVVLPPLISRPLLASCPTVAASCWQHYHRDHTTSKLVPEPGLITIYYV